MIKGLMASFIFTELLAANMTKVMCKAALGNRQASPFSLVSPRF